MGSEMCIRDRLDVVAVGRDHLLAMTLEGLAGIDNVRGVDRVPLALDADLLRVDVVVNGSRRPSSPTLDLSTCLDLSTVHLFSSLLLVAKEDLSDF